MNVLLALLVLVLAVVVLLLLAFLAAWFWMRRGNRRVEAQFGDAAQFIRRRGADPTLSRRLADLAADHRTPSASVRWLDRLVRYRHEPLVIAPEWVPVLGWFDEVTVESFMLRRTWRSLPPAIWDEYVPDSRPQAVTAAAQASGPVRAGAGLTAVLTELDQTGQGREVLRTLERRLPEWPISAVVVQVAREVLELEGNVETARTTGVPEPVTERLAAEARVAATALWDLAGRISAAASFGLGSDRLEERLGLEETRLLELRSAIRDARTGLAELTLAGAGDAGDLERAERRFRALARTAADLQELES